MRVGWKSAGSHEVCSEKGGLPEGLKVRRRRDKMSEMSAEEIFWKAWRLVSLLQGWEVCLEVCLGHLPGEEGGRAGGAAGDLPNHPDSWEVLGAKIWRRMLSCRSLLFWKMIGTSKWHVLELAWFGRGRQDYCFGVFLKEVGLNNRNLPLL